MKYLVCDFYNDFICVGDKCPSTCCTGGWGILIEEDTKKIYDSVKGEFSQILKNCIYSPEKFINN